MDTLVEILGDIRVFLYGGVTTLPFTMAGTMLLLGLFTANYAMLFFLAGLLVVAPVSTWIINQLLGLFFSNDFKVQETGVCSLIQPFLSPSSSPSSPSSTEDAVLITNWSAMVAFFMVYLLTNAIMLYKRKAKGDASKVSYRKTQAMVSVVSIFISIIALFYIRAHMDCDHLLGLFLACIMIGGIAVQWYRFLSVIGEDRLSDLFGMANRILSPGATDNTPMACLPVPKDKVPMNR